MIVERIYLPSIEFSNAMNAVTDKSVNQSQLAKVYADCISSDPGMKHIDWTALNKAILARWPKGLERVKEKAWKELECRR